MTDGATWIYFLKNVEKLVKGTLDFWKKSLNSLIEHKWKSQFHIILKIKASLSYLQLISHVKKSHGEHAN